MRTIRHLRMLYHYQMALMYDKKFKHHCKMYEIIFESVHGKQEGK